MVLNLTGRVMVFYGRARLLDGHSDSHTPYEVLLNKFLWPMC